MAFVKIERVLSVSSEDPVFPADNLLKSDNKRKWKCKAGEKQASVILQLQQDSYIQGIDIGNEHSAFVEVLVARSSTQSNDFKVLLLTSALMSLKESKDGTNTNGVRFFKKADLAQPAVDEKWDRVKIVCTQPFNKHIQYGLSFIVLHSSARQSDEDGENIGALGRFALKKEEDEQPSVGSWFAKRKDPPPSLPPGAAAAIRDASTPALAEGKLKKPTSKRPKVVTPTNGSLKLSTNEDEKSSKPDSTKVKRKKQALNMASFIDDNEDSPADDTDADSTYSPSKDTTSVISNDDVLEDMSGSEDEMAAMKGRRGGMYFSPKPKRKTTQNNGQATKRKTNDIGATSKAKVAKIDRVTKTFNRLLEGVTIVISGYQNPLRGDLRSKACSMGARYKADWDPSCTHLICAFVNTPKFNQVRGRGKIVKKEWVQECHNRRRRLPWRRFALDKADAGTSSEEEIWEESIPTTSNMNGVSNASAVSVIESGMNRRRVSSGSDTEEEIERVLARQTANKVATPNHTKTDVPVTSDPFAEETDVDSGSESQTSQLPLPSLPDFFRNIAFHIASDIYGDERKKLHRYITAYEGRVADEVDGSVEYIITNDQDIAAEVGEEFGISAVSSEWIWNCSDNQKLIPVDSYVL